MFTTADPAAPIVEMRGIGRRFHGIAALTDVDFAAMPGEVHALIGENGAGKSTLMRILAGADQADQGSLRCAGRDLGRGAGIRRHRAAGVATVYQELMTVPEMTAAANVFLGAPRQRGLMLLRDDMDAAFGALCARLGVEIEPGIRAAALSIAERQTLEIMRALATDCRVLIMDEPTAALGASERDRLYAIIGELRRGGVAVIYISHDLDEVRQLSDRISVMRAGRLVASAPTGEWNKARMVEAIAGQQIDPVARRSRSGLGTEPALRVQGLSIQGKVSDISFCLRRGEIFGIAGLVGSGRSEILRALAGDDPTASGTIEMNGRCGPLPGSVRAAIRRGIAMVPEDRKAEGFVPLLDGATNLWLTDLNAVSMWGLVRKPTALRRAGEECGAIGFAPENLGKEVRDLSGGNQQKLVIGKWLHMQPAILLLDEPTRGVDIGAREDIYRVIGALAQSGLSVVLVSSELEEVLKYSDTVAVLAAGRFQSIAPAAGKTVQGTLREIFLVEETQ